MKTLKIYTLAILIAFVLLMPNFASAAVCFAGDASCGGAGSFDGTYVDPVDDAKNQCLEAGFIPADECLAMLKQLSGYCPYSSEYVKCCGQEYAYSSCQYPLKKDDSVGSARCGIKYKCQCDADVYKYISISSCVKGGYINARPGGASCAAIRSDGGMGIKNEISFKECVCDRGLYPFTQKDCNTNGANADVAGTRCVSNSVDAEGQSVYYSSCKCDVRFYPESNESCEFGGAGKHCIQSGLWFFENCCSCDAFPATGTREAGPLDTNVDRTKDRDNNPVGYEVCPCTKGYNRFKIKKCNAGWRPNAKKSACEPIACGEYLNTVLNKNGYVIATNASQLSLGISNASLSSKTLVYAPESANEVSIASTTINPATLQSGVTYASAYSTWCGKAKRPSIKFTGLSRIASGKKIQNLEVTFANSVSLGSASFIDSRVNLTRGGTLGSSSLLFKGSNIYNGGTLNVSGVKFEDSNLYNGTLTIAKTANFTSTNTNYDMDKFIVLRTITIKGGHIYSNGYIGTTDAMLSRQNDGDLKGRVIGVNLNGGAIWYLKRGATIYKLYMGLAASGKDYNQGDYYTFVGSGSSTSDGAVVLDKTYRYIRTAGHEHDRGSRDNQNAVCYINGNGQREKYGDTYDCVSGNCEVRSIGTSNGCNNRGDPEAGIITHQ